MYLPEGKRAQLRECIENHQSNIGLDPGENKISNIKGFHDTEGGRRVTQLLFDARDGKEVFTPF